jgi:hypothetical protein
MTGKADWTLIMNPSGQGIIGVASSSQATPIKRKGFELVDAAFADKDCYCAWQFIYSPRRLGAALPSGVNMPPGTAPGPTNPAPFNPGLTPRRRWVARSRRGPLCRSRPRVQSDGWVRKFDWAEFPAPGIARRANLRQVT